MYVDRVLPAARVVVDIPLFDRVQRHLHTRFVTVHELAVDGPHTVVSFEIEVSNDAWRRGFLRQIVEVWVGGRVDAVIRDGRKVNNDLQRLVSLVWPKNISRRSATVGLLETVLNVESLPGVLGEVDDHIRSLCDSEPDTFDLNRIRHQIPVNRDLVELVMRVQVRQVGQEELVETRWTSVQPAEAIATWMHVHHWIDLSVDEELVSEHAVKIERIHHLQARVLIENDVAKDHVDIEVAVVTYAVSEAGQVKSGGLIASIKVVVEVVHPHQTLVDVLRCEIEHMVVIPERAHRLVDVTALGYVCGIHSGEDVRVVLIVELAAIPEVAREAVAFGGRMAIVQVCGHLIFSEATVVGRQIVMIANQDGLSIFRNIKRTRNLTVEAPHRLQGQVRVDQDRSLSLSDLIELLRRKLGERLVCNGASFTGARIRRNRGRRIESSNRLLDNKPGERLGESAGRWTRRRVGQNAAATSSRDKVSGAVACAGAQSFLRDEKARAGKKAHLHHLAPAQLGRYYFPPVLLRVVIFFLELPISFRDVRHRVRPSFIGVDTLSHAEVPH